jgi:hypothetical protein
MRVAEPATTAVVAANKAREMRTWFTPFAEGLPWWWEVSESVMA